MPAGNRGRQRAGRAGCVKHCPWAERCGVLQRLALLAGKGGTRRYMAMPHAAHSEQLCPMLARGCPSSCGGASHPHSLRTCAAAAGRVCRPQPQVALALVPLLRQAVQRG